jgi:multicomponent K+:H+ antiporter subunit D
MSHWVVAPIVLPLLAAILILAGAGVGIAYQRALGVLATLLLVPITLQLWGLAADGTVHAYALGDWAPPFGIVLVLDRLSAFMLVLTALLAAAAVVYAAGGVDAHGKSFHTLFQLQLMGINGAFLTGDLFNLFVFFEVLLLASYGLLLHGGGGDRSRAGFAYVALNLVGSSVFLVGLGLLYGSLGSLNLADVARRIALAGPDVEPLVYTAALLLFAVFALKAAIVFLHFWLPQAYSAATAPVAALFAIMTKVGIYAILRVSSVAFPDGPVAELMAQWLVPIGLATLLVGTLGALGARRFSELVAYMVVASVGTLLAVFGLGSEQALIAGFYYLAHSTLVTGALFLLAGVLGHERGECGDRFHVGPVAVHQNVLGLLFLLGAASVSGMPPFSGFFGKLMALEAARDTALMPWFWAIVLVTGLLTIVMFSRVGSLLIWKGTPTEVHTPETHRAAWAGLWVLVLASPMLVVFAGPIVDAVGSIATQMSDPSAYIDGVLGSGARIAAGGPQ